MASGFFGLIDADALIVPYVKKYEESRNIMGVISEAEYTLEQWLKGAGAKECVLYFSSQNNWRKAVCPSYKSNRPPKTDGFISLMAQATKHFEEKYRCVTVDGMEADDLLGFVATNPQQETTDCILSFDKDFYGIPAYFMRVGTAKNNDKAPVLTSLLHANYIFHMQWMAGDPTDGFKGIPGIGLKKAEKLLEAVAAEDRETLIFTEFLKKGKKLGEPVRESVTNFLLNCWMARILRYGEIIWDSAGKPDVKLYVPTVDPDVLAEAFAEIKGAGSKQIKDAFTKGCKASAWKVV